MNGTTSTPVATTAPQSAPIPAAGSGAGSAATNPVTLPLPGSRGGAPSAIDLPLVGVARPVGSSELTVPLDAFSKRAGPDVAVSTDAGMVRVHAVFQMDPTTKEMSVSVVDEAGRLVRMIPPDSVAKMIAAMAAYRGR